jgi:hypothetical protein
VSSSRSARALRAVPSAPAPAEGEQAAADDPRRQEIERTLDAFRSLLPPAALEALREDMLGFATTHPVMKEIWSRAKPRPAPDSSGVVATEKGK